MVLDVPLHGNQAVAELQAHRALVGCGPIVSAEVLDHGGVVPGTLTAETTLEGFLSWKSGQSVQKTGNESRGLELTSHFVCLCGCGGEGIFETSLENRSFFCTNILKQFLGKVKESGLNSLLYIHIE